MGRVQPYSTNARTNVIHCDSDAYSPFCGGHSAAVF